MSLDSRLGWKTNRLRRSGRKGGRKWKGRESLGAGTSFPLAGTPGTSEAEREFTALRFTSLSPDQQGFVLLIRASISVVGRSMGGVVYEYLVQCSLQGL